MNRKPKEHSKKGREKNFVAVTQRLFSVIEALSQQRKSGVPLDEITQITGLPKTTVHRLLYSMVKLGFVDQDLVSSLYMLSGKFFELGTNALPYQRLTVLAKPLMKSLLLTFGESVNLAVSRGGVAIYVLVQESPKAHRVAAQEGDYSYLHCTAVGKAIAAHMSPNELEEALVCHGMPAMTPATITTRSALQEELERVRSTGIAIDNEENIQGIICVGGPIFASDGNGIAALSISAPAARIAQFIPTITVALREAVQKISLLMGYPIIPQTTRADLVSR